MYTLSINTESCVTTLCLVRHGQSTWNAQRRIQGQLDPPLSELGKNQAELVAKRLKGKPWSSLYSSDLNRAHWTAKAISKHIGLTVNIKKELRERSHGKREGMFIDDARKKYPDPDDPKIEGETDQALRDRALKAFEGIRDTHLGENIVVVTHGAIMRSFLEAVLGPLKSLPILNTSCTLLKWDGESWECEYIADASHIETQ